jgi:CO/xanthine dehydrogenase FAD-binding subunit
MELTWYYPSRLEEVPALLDQPGVLLHGGGTALLTRSLAAVRGLIDVGRLPLFGFQSRQGRFELGSALTYDQTVREIRKLRPDHVLVQALSRAASNPLRHRITLGGSLAAAPLWSDLIGPLLALEAELVLIGRSEGVFPVERWLAERDLRKGSLITAVRFDDPGWSAGYHRETLTTFDYPAFTVTCLLRLKEGRISASRLALTGGKARALRLRGLENELAGSAAADFAPEKLRLPEEVRFAANKLGSPEYLRAQAELALQRVTARLLRS